jgi:hypothetical protein
VQKEDTEQHERTFGKFFEKRFRAKGRTGPAGLWNAEEPDQQNDHPGTAKKKGKECSEERSTITMFRTEMLVKELAIIQQTAENNWKSRVLLMPVVYQKETATMRTVDGHGDPYWSEEHKDRTLEEEKRRTKEVGHEPRELRKRWQESEITLETTKQMVKEKSAKTTAMIALMWGWALARELTDLQDERGYSVFAPEELEIMSGFGLAGGKIHDAMREKDRPQMDEWGLQGTDRQDKIIQDWTGEAQEERASDSSVSYQEGITDSAIYGTRREMKEMRKTIVRSPWRRGTAAWEMRYRQPLCFPQEQVAHLEALDCCIRDLGEERLRRERKTDPELDSRMYELAEQEHRLSQLEKQRDSLKYGRARRKDQKKKRKQERART